MKRERIFWGILFIIAGAFLVVNKLGYFSGINVLSLLLTVFLVGVIVKSATRLNFTGILFPIAFISMIYDKELGITQLTPWTVLIAALLGSIGFTMIFNKPTQWFEKKYNDEDEKFEKIDVKDDSNVRFKNAFNASIKYINTDSFEEADFDCSFGAMKVYFDNATMSKDKATVKLDVSFSGVELYIPKAWNVDNRTNVFLGGVSEKNSNDKTAKYTLTLLGDIKFAGVEIIYI